jgi:hypothetical protein
MDDYKTIEINGFDCDGEPEIKLFEDGHIELMFNFMPPLNGKVDRNNEEYWDSFEKVLSTHLDVQVQREDRELFLILKPKKRTVNKLKLYLETYWEE